MRTTSITRLCWQTNTAAACCTINIIILLYTVVVRCSGVVEKKCALVCLYDSVRRLTALEDTGPRASVDVTPSSTPRELKSVECLGVCVCVSIPWSL